MEILENKQDWTRNYEKGWLAHLDETGAINWDLYEHPRNRSAPGAAGVELAKSRLMFISSAGAYLKHEQPPCDAANPTGDYSLRSFPTSTPFSALAYAHDHFDHTMVEQDAQVALPLRHLERLGEEGVIGDLAPSMVSFMGYQPDAARVVDELAPAVLNVARQENIQAALLAPV
ncbi:MAG: hypothetical protein GY759_03715 [Chloroflexi bacterium]|nr:hypothetical protein [Chloroflexota bacterium]